MTGELKLHAEFIRATSQAKKSKHQQFLWKAVCRFSWHSFSKELMSEENSDIECSASQREAGSKTPGNCSVSGSDGDGDCRRFGLCRCRRLWLMTHQIQLFL